MRKIYLRFHNHYIDKLRKLREEKWSKQDSLPLEDEKKSADTRTVAQMITGKIIPLDLKHATCINLTDEVPDFTILGMCDPNDRNSIRQAITRLEIDAYDDYTPKHRAHYRFNLKNFNK